MDRRHVFGGEPLSHQVAAGRTVGREYWAWIQEDLSSNLASDNYWLWDPGQDI